MIDGIATNLCSLCYASVDNIVSIIKKLDRVTELVKQYMYIKDTYCLVPGHQLITSS